MTTKQQQHPLRKYSENEQIAYLSVLASLGYIDKDFSEVERKKLDAFLNELQMSDSGRAIIYSAIFNFQHEDRASAIQTINTLQSADLKFTLISDLLLLAYVDNNFSEEERQYIYDIGSKLNITKEQIEVIRNVQENLSKIQDIPSNSEHLKELVKESTSKLAGAGIPVAAIAASGSVFGLSAAGITSGLATLGALVGGGMLAGTVLVVPAIAIASAWGVKKLFDLVWKKENV